jgi:N-alpha-acetyltransferase 15/16, NatA auxiliary subunit
MVLHESGALHEAIQHLDRYGDQICDKLAVLETYGKYLHQFFDKNFKLIIQLAGRLYLETGRYRDAEAIYRKLLLRNPENTEYYKLLQDALRLENPDDKLKLFEEYREKFPRAQAPQRLPLALASGEQFKVLVDKYLRKGLHKGVPPLFVDLRSLYKDPKKVEIIHNLILQYIDSLRKCGNFAMNGKHSVKLIQPLHKCSFCRG